MRVCSTLLLVLSLLACGCAIGPTQGTGERSVNAELASSLRKHCWGAEQVTHEEPCEHRHLLAEPGCNVTHGGCGEECCLSPDECNSNACSPRQGCCLCNGRGCGNCMGNGCRGVLGHIGAAMATTPAHPVPDINNVPSRFHPAPVRPVFSPSGPNWGPVAAKPNVPATGGNLGGL